ncbi:oxygen-independent coproporphyrinogen III oxidase [Echinicola jeungdonensis]|uniref:Coproporphyrinogen-III oxidase n=1 Tax=Echinicola jeungdonensis TaxID=709343 RepID=A0ABV5J4Q7_9BACT|nr:oxygen-independent coproporphyrinogen III oxidase [Echinicola jeungdonensis]MDN3667893.1 oxygen-independent coproporphyrinogen III oxidase [Echinicola jeungdonensis]
MISKQLLKKYDVAVPRYTSYPTVPLWEDNLNEALWIQKVQKAYQDFGCNEGITLYIHLPFCESLCTYCGCNKRITKNHQNEGPYIQGIIKEWEQYLKVLPEKPKLAGIHLGGGTPTFFSPENLRKMISFIRESSTVLPHAEFSFEGHPNNTTMGHLKSLNQLGFDRVSYGIQDLNPLVQKTINRIQPLEKVIEATGNARKAGFKAINFDLIYGLPHQTVKTIKETVDAIAPLKPERIAFYSYAHVPTVFPAQRSFEAHLPMKDQKRELYETGKRLLEDLGYIEIGMDHFSLKEDTLYQAQQKQGLHRNFMGYTTQPSKMLLGLGNSAISDVYYAYAQNTKDIDLYLEQTNLNHLSISRGHLMNHLDIEIRQTILDLMCHYQTPLEYLTCSRATISDLEDLADDGLVILSRGKVQVTELGKPFIRNICAAFDQRMHDQRMRKFMFSKAI